MRLPCVWSRRTLVVASRAGVVVARPRAPTAVGTLRDLRGVVVACLREAHAFTRSEGLVLLLTRDAYALKRRNVKNALTISQDQRNRNLARAGFYSDGGGAVTEDFTRALRATVLGKLHDSTR